MAEPIGIAVIGTGSIAEAHLYAYQKAAERVRLVAVVDTVETRARSVAERYGASTVLTDYRDVLSRDDVQAVSICTPPAWHVGISVDALRARKHVLCEKPVAPTLQGLDQIEAASDESGTVFSGVFQLRFGKGAMQLRIMLDDGSLGKLHLGMAETLWYRDAAYFAVPWRATWADQCGGVTVSQAIHLIDALIGALGVPVSVFARASGVRAMTECEETAVAVIHFESGAIGQVTSTVVATGPEISRFEIFGTAGSVHSRGSAYDATAEPMAIAMPDMREAEALGAALEQRVPHGYRMLHRPQVEDFLDAIEKGRPPMVGIPECRAVLNVTAGIYKSAMTGEVVQLPLQKDDPWYSELLPRGFKLEV
jgi:predicted dehydrogenase